MVLYCVVPTTQCSMYSAICLVLYVLYVLCGDVETEELVRREHGHPPRGRTVSMEAGEEGRGGRDGMGSMKGGERRGIVWAK